MRALWKERVSLACSKRKKQGIWSRRSTPHALADLKMEGPWEKECRQPLRADSGSQLRVSEETRSSHAQGPQTTRMASACNLDELGRQEPWIRTQPGPHLHLGPLWALAENPADPPGNSDPQNSEIITGHCVKPPGLWSFVTHRGKPSKMVAFPIGGSYCAGSQGWATVQRWHLSLVPFRKRSQDLSTDFTRSPISIHLGKLTPSIKVSELLSVDKDGWGNHHTLNSWVVRILSHNRIKELESLSCNIFSFSNISSTAEHSWTLVS